MRTRAGSHCLPPLPSAYYGPVQVLVTRTYTTSKPSDRPPPPTIHHGILRLDGSDGQIQGRNSLSRLATLPFPRGELGALYSSLYIGSSFT